MTAPFSWRLPYAWPRKPLLARNVVATSQPLAAQAGLQMLADGGNAVDAIVATAITLTLVEPVSNGIGSDAFAIVWDGQATAWAERSGRSPAAWTPEYFGGNGVPAVRLEFGDRAGRGVGVGRVARQVRQAAVPRLFEPAICYGRKGFLVSPTIAGQWAAQVPLFESSPASPRRSCPAGGRREPAN